MSFDKIIKTKREIKLIEKSAKISDSCLELIKKSLREKITEKELARKIRKKLKSLNAKQSFQTIVACEKRSAKIHPKPPVTNKIVSGIGYVDFGVCYKGYRTDVTVPFIKGNVGKKEKEIVKTVLKAYKLAINSIKLGMPCWKLHKKINVFLRKYGLKMSHNLGHGIGLKIHELPVIGEPRKKLKGRKKLRWEKLKKIKFQDGMVFTIEPGVYVKGIGGCRLENDFLIKNKHLKALTHANLILTK